MAVILRGYGFRGYQSRAKRVLPNSEEVYTRVKKPKIIWVIRVKGMAANRISAERI
jgi:hypothetical protein